MTAWPAAYRLPPVCLLGHSFGAEVAAALAAVRHLLAPAPAPTFALALTDR